MHLCILPGIRFKKQLVVLVDTKQSILECSLENPETFYFLQSEAKILAGAQEPNFLNKEDWTELITACFIKCSPS
jgi:hypothetical protein